MSLHPSVHARTVPDKTAYRMAGSGAALTYRDLDRISNQGAQLFRALGLKPTERVNVVSRRGTIRSLDLRLTETIGAGQVFVPFHWAEANANQATQSAFDPVSREPNYKQCAVRVERSR